MPELEGSKVSIALLVPAFMLAALAAQARVNLPQLRRVAALPPELAHALRSRFAAEASAPEISPGAEELLLRALPEDVHDSCAAMIEHWGLIARGSAEWNARALHRDAHRVWLAYRCSSRTPEYEDVYDERPALLRLDAGQLEFFPLAPDSKNESTLYHLEFSQLVPLRGAQGVAFKVAEPGENPCCDGPESRSGETWRIFAEMPRGVAELLSVVTARDDSSHSDDPEVDSETTYRAELTLERGAGGLVTAINAAFGGETKEFVGDAPPRIADQRSGTLRYRWNPTSMVFAEMK